MDYIRLYVKVYFGAFELCKQEVAGSSPAGSTNLNSFSSIYSLFPHDFQLTTPYENLTTLKIDTDALIICNSLRR